MRIVGGSRAPAKAAALIVLTRAMLDCTLHGLPTANSRGFRMTVLLLALCVPGATAGDEIVAAAWDGARIQDLGRLYTADFEPVLEGDRYLVAAAAQPVIIPLGATDREFRHGANQAEFVANARAWGLLKAGLSVGKDSTYAIFRATERSELAQVDEDALVATESRSARYYIHAIYLGRMYEVDFWGQGSHVGAALGGSLPTFSGDIDAWAKQNSVQYKIRTVGLQPRETSGGSGLFARTDADVEKMYEASGDPRPILVVFREVPPSLKPAEESTTATPATDVDVMALRSISVRLGKVSLPAYGPGGSGWDALEGAPDISVWIKANGSVVYRSPIAEDTYKYDFSTTALSGLQPKAAPVLTFTVSDSDISDNDLAARWDLSLPSLGTIPVDGKVLTFETDSGVRLDVEIIPAP